MLMVAQCLAIASTQATSNELICNKKMFISQTRNKSSARCRWMRRVTMHRGTRAVSLNLIKKSPCLKGVGGYG